MLAIDYDAADAAPASKHDLMDIWNSIKGAAWQSFCVDGDTKDLRKMANKRYVRSGPLADNLDIKTYDVGNLVWGVSGAPATFGGDGVTPLPIGELYVTYDVELETPTKNDSLVPPPIPVVLGAAPAGNWFGIGSAAPNAWTTLLTGPPAQSAGLQMFIIDPQTLQFVCNQLATVPPMLMPMSTAFVLKVDFAFQTATSVYPNPAMVLTPGTAVDWTVISSDDPIFGTTQYTASWVMSHPMVVTETAPNSVYFGLMPSGGPPTFTNVVVRVSTYFSNNTGLRLARPSEVYDINPDVWSSARPAPAARAANPATHVLREIVSASASGEDPLSVDFHLSSTRAKTRRMKDELDQMRAQLRQRELELSGWQEIGEAEKLKSELTVPKR